MNLSAHENVTPANMGLPVLTVLHEDSPNARYLYAASNGLLANLKSAIADGASLLAYSDELGQSYDALLWAVLGVTDEAVIRHLLELNVDRADRSHLSPTLLNTLILRKRADLVELLIQRGASVEIDHVKHPSASTPLMIAAMHDREDLVDLLLEHGASATARTVEGVTALHVAKGRGTLCKLLAAGAEIEARDREERTPLMLAAYTREVESMSVLLEHGADIKARCTQGHTALHHAAQMGGNSEAIELLLDRGIEAEARSKRGNSALHLAAMTGDTGIVGLLLERGLNPSATSDSGLRPVDLATNADVRAIFAAWTARRAMSGARASLSLAK